MLPRRLCAPHPRVQPVDPRHLVEAVADLATVGDNGAASGSIVEIADPRTENLVNLGAMLAAKRGDAVARIGLRSLEWFAALNDSLTWIRAPGSK